VQQKYSEFENYLFGYFLVCNIHALDTLADHGRISASQLRENKWIVRMINVPSSGFLLGNGGGGA